MGLYLVPYPRDLSDVARNLICDRHNTPEYHLCFLHFLPYRYSVVYKTRQLSFDKPYIFVSWKSCRAICRAIWCTGSRFRSDSALLWVYIRTQNPFTDTGRSTQLDCLSEASIACDSGLIMCCVIRDECSAVCLLWSLKLQQSHRGWCLMCTRERRQDAFGATDG